MEEGITTDEGGLDFDCLDFHTFATIMQEPPQQLADSCQSHDRSFQVQPASPSPLSHCLYEREPHEGAAQQIQLSGFDFLPCEPACYRTSSEAFILDSRYGDTAELPPDEEDQEGSNSLCSGSSQSDVISQPSEISMDVYRQPVERIRRMPNTNCPIQFIQESEGVHNLDDLNSNANSANSALPMHIESHPSNKVLVDLTADSDSGSEDDLIRCHKFVGKRILPSSSFEPQGKPSKDPCLRPLLHERVYNLESSPNKDYSSIGAVQESVHSNILSNTSFMSHSALPLSLDRKYSSQSCADDASNRGILGPALLSAYNSNFVKMYSTSALSDVMQKYFPPTYGSQSGSAKDYIPGHPKEAPSKGLLKILDDSFYTEESSPDEGLMAVSLLKHQRIALAWMEKRERGAECAGGILADDQGLGKTVSTIALILKVKPPVPISSFDTCKQLSCEASTVDLDDEEDFQAQNENLLRWSQKDRSCQENSAVISRGRLSAGTLVVCPTSVLRQWALEIKEKVAETAGLNVLLYHGSNRTKDANDFAKHDIVLTTYSIVSMEVPKQPLPDEKDAEERNAGNYGLTASLSSGQNILKKKPPKMKKPASDSVNCGPLANVVWFRVVLDEAQNIKNRKTQAARACWGLRAKRRWCLSGTPIQNTIDDLYSYFRFLKYDPFSSYRSFRSEIKDPIARNPVNGYRKLQAILQKVFLRRTKMTLINGEPIVTLPEKKVKLEQVDFSPAERDFYINLETQSRQRFQMYAAAGTVQRNYVNILLMLLRLRQACDHPHLVKDHYSDATQQSTKESASKLSDDKRARLLSVLEGNQDTCSICMDAPEDAVITLCGHVFCRQCLFDMLSHDDSAYCPYPKCHVRLHTSGTYSWSALRYPNGVTEGPPEPPLDLISQVKLENVPETSSKIKAVIHTLRALPPIESVKSLKGSLEHDDLPSDPGGVRTEKAIVFSQWTSMLDLLEVSLKKEGFCYRRLDGTMSLQARDRALSDFKLLPEVSVIIMSLKAASLGLNMVAASHVLLIDVWWNPTTEDQAIDRAHRIGQTRDVHVSRFTVKNTIEDRILALQEKKRQIVASAFGEDAGTDQKTRLSFEDMSYLFRA